MTSTDVTTTEPSKESSGAKVQRDRIDQFMGFLQDPTRNLPQLLSDSGIEPARFLAVARRAISNNPDLLNCTPASLLKAFINCATDGLLPDGRQAAIVIYKTKSGTKEAQYQSMYQGLLDVAYRSGNFTSIQARVVYEGDHFDYALGDNEFIEHRPAKRPTGFKPAIVNSYAIAKTVNGGIFREVFEAEDIRKVNAVSRATNGPGKDWAEEMSRKGPLRRMWKFLPKNDAMARIAEHRDAVPDDLIDLDATEVRPRRLQTGFSPRAISQGADQTVDIPVDQVPEDPPVEDVVQDGATAPQEQAQEAQVQGEAPDLPPDYDIGAWASQAADALGAFKTPADYDAWLKDPETQVRFARLRDVDAQKYDTLVSASKARRKKLESGK